MIPLGFTGEELTTYRFYNIFPKIVSEIELNMDTPDTAATFQVTFGYSHWVQLESESANASVTATAADSTRSSDIESNTNNTKPQSVEVVQPVERLAPTATVTHRNMVTDSRYLKHAGADTFEPKPEKPLFW
jgi:hypothetical protein